MKAYKHLVKHALADGFTVSVYDGEIWEVKRSGKYQQIIDCIESVEEASIRIYDNGTLKGWADVSAYGLEDDETVFDYGMNEYMETWDNIYMSTQQAA